MSNQERVTKVNNWIETIVTDVSEMSAQHHVFWKLVHIIGENSEIIATPFYYWLGEAFKSSAAIAVRRQVDNRRDVVSFYKLLEELRKSPLLITRDYFVNLPVFFPDGPLRIIFEPNAHQIFDKLVGEGRPRLEKAQIQADSDSFVAKAETIKHYVDNLYAHRSQKPLLKPIPKLIDLDQCLNSLKQLTGKYHYLIKGSPYNFDLHPDYFDDWHAIFKFPWIQSDSHSTIANNDCLTSTQAS